MLRDRGFGPEGLSAKHSHRNFLAAVNYGFKIRGSSHLVGTCPSDGCCEQPYHPAIRITVALRANVSAVLGHTAFRFGRLRVKKFRPWGFAA